eukprot:CAMPEP_0179441754 /NCGR_PEP_ID=MMETSP0799-20121207/25260_1 /TAXON_ID=46947 /ORGANISM="Geminigera cryophila, Strain CCMP2564" /LENGTH=224 /DNA_ID=CAMNT_0021226233 /DNA_START=195 /DNA_END=868 /DNA_ORIENTATION=+
MKEPASPAGDGSDAKKLDRMLKNRLSAKRSREIAKNHVVLLEKNVAVLSRQAQLLTARLASVEAENARLRHAQWMNPFVAVRDERSCAASDEREKKSSVPRACCALIPAVDATLALLLVSSGKAFSPHVQPDLSQQPASGDRAGYGPDCSMGFEVKPLPAVCSPISESAADSEKADCPRQQIERETTPRPEHALTHQPDEPTLQADLFLDYNLPSWDLDDLDLF